MRAAERLELDESESDSLGCLRPKMMRDVGLWVSRSIRRQTGLNRPD